MSTQIVVRIPEELVEFIDVLSRSGAGSREAIIARALTLYRGRISAEADASILERTGDYADFDGPLGANGPR